MPTINRRSSLSSATPQTQLLSNGFYAVMITAAGSGYSRWRDLAITRWRADATRDDTGAYIFLLDVVSGQRWSAGFQPTGQEPASYDAFFADDRVEFVRRDWTLTTRLEVIVSPEDDAEVRRVSLTNHGDSMREIEVTSYAEIVLAPAAADAAHPAFSNLFIQTERVPERDALLATRRVRAPEDTEIWLAHVVAVEGETIGDLQYETDRARFLGRGRDVRAPHAEARGVELSNTVGSVLDPIISLRRRVRVHPGQTVRLTFSTIVAPSRTRVLDLAQKYQDVTAFDRLAILASIQAQLALQQLGIGPEDAGLFQELGASLLFVDRSMRAPADVVARRVEGVGALWANGISGDLPIVLVKIDKPGDIGTVRQLLCAHAYWRSKNLAADLVILNDATPVDVKEDLQVRLDKLVEMSQSGLKQSTPEGSDARRSVFTLRADQVTGAQRDVLESVARIVLSGESSLAEQVDAAHRAGAAPVNAVTPATPPRPLPPAVYPVGKTTKAPDAELEFYNGIGGFDADGREYVIVLRPGQWTPAPWINVLANPDFGCLVSEAGAGCTWSINSQENRLTPWSNDPVSDPPSDIIYIRDDDSGELWTVTPLPIREKTGEYVARHGQGYTRFEYDAHGVALELLQFVPVNDPIKISRLVLTNHSSRVRHLSVTSYVEWVLGGSRVASAPFVTTEIDPPTGAMLAQNSWSTDFGTRIAFADLGGAQTSLTGDRTEFLGRHGAADSPAALSRDEPLSGNNGVGLDPCAALQTKIEVPPGGQMSIVCFLGQCDTRESATALIQKYRSADIDSQLKAVTDMWAHVLGTMQVKTPDRSLDIMLNHWLLYQTLSCRVWGRAAFYQSSGAYGFRDQLQDVMALAVSRPDLTRAQILKAASRQFVEGDVQHWWHEPVGRGVRTRISDDLLWLPYVASHYLSVTGDEAVIDEAIPFLEGAVLTEGQSESLFEPRISSGPGTLFEHCARALDRSLGVGGHGLPLMGTGDWNDGMNRVGIEGRGESVWLAWFLHAVLSLWSPIAAARGETKRAEAWTLHARKIKDAVEREAWDGRWYRRAYFDDGTPLGSAGSDACAIDSIAQSWSVISEAGDRDRSRRAMASLDEHLVRERDDIILLLTPPFDRTALEPGYIKGYVPGIRENGGQYTHGAVWAVIAFAVLGDGDKAGRLFGMLNPITHTMTPHAVQQYRVEPYVAVGDIYSEAPHVGRGGWSWYTGSAGWLYRAGIEWLLGLRRQGTRLAVNPCIPSGWPGFRVTFRYGSAQYDIAVENPFRVCRGVTVLELDGVALDDRTGIPLADDQKIHRVRAVLGNEGAQALVAAP